MAIMPAAFDPRFGEAWNQRQTDAMLATPLSRHLVAIAPDGSPAGFALSRAIAGEEELLLIAVHPDHRKQGYGAALLARVIATARDAGIQTVFLEVRANNPALQFYHNFGFAAIGRRPGYYQGSDGARFDAITLALPIGDLPD